MEQRPGLEQGALGPGALPPAFPLAPTSASTQDRRCPVEHGAGAASVELGALSTTRMPTWSLTTGPTCEFVYVGGRLLLIRKRISR